LVKIEAILDAVRTARERGFAVVDGELEEGLAESGPSGQKPSQAERCTFAMIEDATCLFPLLYIFFGGHCKKL
jgi:hypothetical protein